MDNARYSASTRVIRDTMLNVVVIQSSDQYQILEVLVDGRKYELLKPNPFRYVVIHSRSINRMVFLHLLNLYTTSLGCWSVFTLARWNVWVVYPITSVACAMLATTLWKEYSMCMEQKRLSVYLLPRNRNSR